MFVFRRYTNRQLQRLVLATVPIKHSTYYMAAQHLHKVLIIRITPPPHFIPNLPSRASCITVALLHLVLWVFFLLFSHSSEYAYAVRCTLPNMASVRWMGRIESTIRLYTKAKPTELFLVNFRKTIFAYSIHQQVTAIFVINADPHTTTISDRGAVYSIHHYIDKFISEWRQVTPVYTIKAD